MGVTYIEPALPLLLLLGFIDVVRAWRRSDRRRRPWLQTFVIAGVTFLTMNVGAWLLARPLEYRYNHDIMPNGTADAIVVLSGGVNPPALGRPYPLPARDTYRRVQHAAWLYKSWKPLPILVCGGGRPDAPHAETMRRVLEAEGIPRNMIWLESRSMNTHENAVFGAEILRAHNVSRVVLSVEANYMPRAELSFKKVGIEIVPSPVRFTQLSGDLSDVIPGWPALQSNGETIHEILGLAWYKLRGWI